MDRQTHLLADSDAGQKTNVFSALVSRCAVMLVAARVSGRILRRRREFPLSEMLQILEVRHALSGLAVTLPAESTDAVTTDATIGDFSPIEGQNEKQAADPSATENSDSVDAGSDILACVCDEAPGIAADASPIFGASQTREWQSADKIVSDVRMIFSSQSNAVDVLSPSLTDREASSSMLSLDQTADLSPVLPDGLSSSDHRTTDAVFAMLATASHPELFARAPTTSTAASAPVNLDSTQVVVAELHPSNSDATRVVAWQNDTSLRHQSSGAQQNPVLFLGDSILSCNGSVDSSAIADDGVRSVTNKVQLKGLPFDDNADLALDSSMQPCWHHAITRLFSSVGLAEDADHIAGFLVMPGNRFDDQQPQLLLSVTESQPKSANPSELSSAKAISDARGDRRFQLRLQRLNVSDPPDPLQPNALTIVAAAPIVFGISFCLYRVVARGPPRGPPRSDQMCSDRRNLRQSSHQLNRLKFSISPRGPSLAVRISKPVTSHLSGPGRTFRASSLS